MAQNMGGVPGNEGARILASAAKLAAAMAATTNEDLARWLARVALGDRAAFEQVYRATSGHLLSVAFRILNQRERAEEVLQEAFVNVWHHAAGFNASVASPMTWLINIVRNKAIDLLRSAKTERASTFELDDEAHAVVVRATEAQMLSARAFGKVLRVARTIADLDGSDRVRRVHALEAVQLRAFDRPTLRRGRAA